MQTHVILLNVNHLDEISRTDLEGIEGMTFNNNSELCNHLKSDKFKLYNMSDFVDLCNNEEFNVDDHFVTYIKYVNMPEGYYYV